MQLTSHRQTIAAIVAPSTDNERMKSLIATEHERAHAEGRALHQHRAGYPHVLDHRTVQLSHLRRREHPGPLFDRVERGQEGVPGIAVSVRIAATATVSRVVNEPHSAPFCRTCHSHHASPRERFHVRERDLQTIYSQSRRQRSRFTVQIHRRRGTPGHLYLPPGNDTASQELADRLLCSETGRKTEDGITPLPAVCDLRRGEKAAFKPWMAPESAPEPVGRHEVEAGEAGPKAPGTLRAAGSGAHGPLLHGDGLCQVPRLIDLLAVGLGDVVGKEL